MTTDLSAALHAMGIDPWCPQMMAVWPFVELAWTDHRVDDETRSRLLDLVRRRRSLGHSGIRTLEGWLLFRPSDKYLARGRDVARALIHRVNPATDAEPEDLVAYCLDLAAEAARVLGVPADPLPAESVLELAELLDVSPGVAWTDLDAQVGQTVLMESPFADAEDEEPGVDGLLRWAAHEDDGPPSTPGVPAELVQVGKDGGRCWPVDGEILTIGRGPDNDLVLQDVRVSRHHCRVVRRGRSWFIVDNDSANGTHVNGEFVVEAELFGGERIAVGSTTFAFRTREG